MKSMLTVFLSLSLGCSAPQASLGTITSAQASDWPKTQCSLPAVSEPADVCGPGKIADRCSITCEAGSSHAVCTAPSGAHNTTNDQACSNWCRCSYN